MKFILSEEMYAQPTHILNDLQDFIGVREEEKLEFSSFPHENEGKYVSKDYMSSRINNMLQSLELAGETLEERQQVIKWKKILWEHTMVEWREEIPQELCDILFEKYEDSIHELEEMIGRSFKGVWY